MELPKTYEETKEYENKILKNHSGCGTIYTGTHYHLDYQPTRASSQSLKCNGVSLVIRRNKDQYSHDFYSRCVLFKHDVGFIGALLGETTAPFQDRLKSAIDEQIDEIKKAEEHIARMHETADKVVKCQLKIDKTISEVTDGKAIPYTSWSNDSNAVQEAWTDLERQNKINNDILHNKGRVS